MKITIVCVGKIKEAFFRDAVLEYTKRLSRYCTTEIAEVADEKTPENISPLQKEQILAKEAQRILGRIRPDSYVVTLEIAGKKYTSEGFAAMIEQAGIRGISHMTFVIGGSLGLADEVVAAANETISFSALTFPHQLMRVILLEQIYRWHRIIKNEPYHK